MNCYIHSEKEAVAFCRICGKAMCDECQRPSQGTVYCEEHAPVTAQGPAAAVDTGYQPGVGSPGLAFLLGMIPGVGAVYNGQYVKGLVHVIIFGMLISILNAGATGGFEPLFGLLIAIFYLYMPFEAYHTSKRRERGEPVDEFSSLFPIRPRRTGFPAGPVLLIAVGVLFLLNTLGLLHIHTILRWWPAFLIALGVYMLYTRLTGANGKPEARQEVEHGQ